MSEFGEKLIKSLREFVADAKAGKAMKQSFVRRMKVKGKTVYAREEFTAPLQLKKKG